jgi:hypothetical protein
MEARAELLGNENHDIKIGAEDTDSYETGATGNFQDNTRASMQSKLF